MDAAWCGPLMHDMQNLAAEASKQSWQVAAALLVCADALHTPNIINQCTKLMTHCGMPQLVQSHVIRFPSLLVTTAVC